jgi:uncharacterized protein (UPF0261 family)
MVAEARPRRTDRAPEGMPAALTDNHSATAVGLMLSAIFRFVASRSWVFSRAATPAG